MIWNLLTELQTNIWRLRKETHSPWYYFYSISALTNSVSVHIRSRSTSPDRLFLLMLILSISCRTASAVLKKTKKKISLKIVGMQIFLHSIQQLSISNSTVCYGCSKLYKSTKYKNVLISENFRIAAWIYQLTTKPTIIKNT